MFCSFEVTLDDYSDEVIPEKKRQRLLERQRKKEERQRKREEKRLSRKTEPIVCDVDDKSCCKSH